MQTFAPRIIPGLVAALMFAPAISAQDRIGSDFIPPDAVVTAVLTVADTMDSPAAELYPTEVADAWFQENMGILASDIERVKVVVGMPGPGDPMAGAVFQLRSDFDVSKVNPQFVNPQPLDVDGVSAFEIAGPGLLLHVKDPKTVIVASENYLGSMLRAADSEGGGPLGKLAAQVPHTATLTTIVSIEPLRPMVNSLIQMQADQIPPPFVEFTKIPNLLDALFVRVDMENADNGLQIVMLAGDESQATELQETMVNGMRIAQQMVLAQMDEGMDEDDPIADATRRYMQRVSEYYIETMTPQQDGRRLTIRTDASRSLATQGVLIGMLLPAVQSAREAARRVTSSNNMKQIALAIHNYHAARGELPKDIVDESGKPLLSWRVAILPYIEESAMFDQFKMDEPWDSPHNMQLLGAMPLTFTHPGIATPPGMTVYQRPSGEGMMGAGAKVRFRDITDGLSNTIMGVETSGADAVEWTKPADIALDGDDPVALLDDGSRQGFNIMLADGAVLFMDFGVDPSVIKAMLTRSGREIVNPAGLR